MSTLLPGKSDHALRNLHRTFVCTRYCTHTALTMHSYPIPSYCTHNALIPYTLILHSQCTHTLYRHTARTMHSYPIPSYCTHNALIPYTVILHSQCTHTPSTHTAYKVYCNGYEASAATLQRLETNKKWVSFRDTRLAGSVGKGATLAAVVSMLIMPMQRVPRYVLLVRELIKHTWEVWVCSMSAV
jgi:hypothetical protein